MRILCFGDSNTYGYDPRSYFGSQYPAQHRWVDLLAQKSGWEVLNAGENGREIPRRESEFRLFEALLSRCQPLDRLLVMLGGNDLLQGNSVETAAKRMSLFLERMGAEKEKAVLIVPPPMKMGAWVTEERLLTDSLRLGDAYRTLARTHGAGLVDTSHWAIELTFDGVHFSEKGHQTFAEKLYLALTQEIAE